MIIGIGTDIIEIQRVAKLINKSRFLSKCYTENEIAVIRCKKAETAAGYFAAKEAASKAMGIGFCGFSPCDIEIAYDRLGKPVLLLHGVAKEIAAEKGISRMHISISHCMEYSAAFAVAEGD